MPGWSPGWCAGSGWLSIAGAYVLFVAIPTTLLPQEDQGAVFVST
jgi:hypothetical protein